jgi:hypothetical protein
MTAPLGDFIRQKWVDLNDGISLFRSRILAGTLTSDRTITTPDRSGVLVTMPTDLVSVANAGLPLRVNAAGTDTEVLPLTYTVATLPITGTIGNTAFVTDEYGGPTLATWNGLHWQRNSDQKICRALGWVGAYTHNWTGIAAPLSAGLPIILTAVAWASGLRKFVAIGNLAASPGNVTRSISSRDGQSWAISNVAADVNWVAMCWSQERGELTACSSTGELMRSLDGDIWSLAPGGILLPGASAICWSKTLKIYVATMSVAGFPGGGNYFASSRDGSTWIFSSVSANSQWADICRAEEIGLFLAVCIDAPNNLNNFSVATSPDGQVWTPRVTPTTGYTWGSICWSPTLRLAVAVSISGTTDRIMTSPDGANWTLRAHVVSQNLRKVCWSEELGLFFIVATSGTGNRIITSPDGTNWTNRVSAANNAWRDIAYSPELRRLVAVSTSGVNRIMTSYN